MAKFYRKPRTRQYADKAGRRPLIACWHCKMMVPKDLCRCRYCGAELKSERQINAVRE